MSTFNDKMSSTTQTTESAETLPDSEFPSFPNPTNIGEGLGMTSIQQQPLTGTEPIHFVARIPEKPETKPLYDNVRNVVNFEYPEVCISSKAKCTCYTNQATIIDEIPEVFCRKFAENGVFNPYKPALNSQPNTQEQGMQSNNMKLG